MLPGRTLHAIFAQRANQAPSRIAVVGGNEEITYGDLNNRADRLARRLIAGGAVPGTLVGLCLERHVDMVVGMLGILKAGCAYVPIDPAYPAKRIEFLCTDSDAQIIVAEAATADHFGNSKARVIRIDRNLASGRDAVESLPETAEDGLAYAIYTSGSTGVPKGVLVEHRQVVRLFEQTEPEFGFNQDDVWTLFHSISFDFSVWEIWGALLYGGRLVIVPSELTRSPDEFYRFVRRNKITVLNQTPSAFRTLAVADQRLGPSGFSVRYIIFGGEALDLNMVGLWIHRYGDRSPALINMYGITETTVHVTYKRILAADLKGAGVAGIGTPIRDLRVHLLDPEGKPVPDGTPGEIYVSGAGLARGYHRRPEFMAERFLPGPPRMYRSGDRAVRMPNGDLAYLGRVDDQLKVRGFRIEPREIELCLAGHTGVMSAIVAVQDYGSGDVRLVAYILPSPKPALNDEGKEKLFAELTGRAAEALPLYMRPSAYFMVSEIPMTAHGKVDREALAKLAEPCRVSSPSLTGAPATATPTERTVLAIWEDILQKQGIGTKDDFFDLGGTSLALIRIFARINAEFRISLNGSILAEEATVSRLANCVDAELKDQQTQMQVAGRN
jgi:amino acid adenylation domain-containing protein